MNKIQETTQAKGMKVGDAFHVLGQTLILRVSRAYDGTKVLEPGAELVLTNEMVELAAEDPNGSWADLIADPAGQVARWGRAKLAPGRSEGSWWTHGDPRWEAERRAALEIVWAISEPSARARALADVQRRFAWGQGREAVHDE